MRHRLTRYVVVCHTPLEDHPSARRVFGPWLDYERASAFAASVNDKVDAFEAKNPTVELGGYAYVMELETARVSDAVAYATRGER